jgi:transcriptional regulator GlxA family with amidase domain
LSHEADHFRFLFRRHRTADSGAGIAVRPEIFDRQRLSPVEPQVLRPRLTGGDRAGEEQSDATPSTQELARELGMPAGWLAEAYRAAAGEGLRDTVRRRRVELATGLLRHSNRAGADIAATAGFCDQSHMIRALRTVLGRGPTQIRAEWAGLRRAALNS